MPDTFSYNELLSSDYNAYVFGSGTYSTPEKSVDSVAVIGRNGNVLFDYGNWENLDIVYAVVIMNDFTRNFLKMRSDFMSLNAGKYYPIRDSFHPTRYRLGVLRSISKPNLASDYGAGTFTVTLL